MSMWLMYLILKLDDITKVLQCIAIIASAILLLNAIAKPNAMTGKLLIMAILLLFIGIILPTTKQAAAIYFVPKVINNKEVSKMPNKLVTLANDWMDEQIKSIKK